MNSNFGKAGNPQKGSVSSNNFDFDFGLGSGLSSNRPRSLNDQKLGQHSSPYSFPSSSSSSSSSTSFSAAQSKPASSAWSMNKPAWTHQPAPTPAARSSLEKPTSMVGDISGKSWTSAAPSAAPSARLGIPEKNPNLFGDLVGSALGKTSSGNVPLKNAAPASANPQTTPATRNAFSMGNVADSLPKTSTAAPANATTHMRNTSWGSGANFGSYSTPTNSGSSNINNNNRNLGGPSMKSAAGLSASSKKDPFGSLVDFGSKSAVNNVNSAASNNSNAGDAYSFGVFQDASKSGTPPFPSDAFPATNNNPMGSASNSGPKMDTFGIPTQEFSSHEQSQPQSTGLDPLDSLISSVSSSAAPTPSGPAEVDDWGIGSEFGGNEAGGTTELEGLPPPPAGVTASGATNKGLDNYKQGQFADAIKWLSWAVVLLEKAGDTVASVEVLSCRASCYKEVGEYKKAVADCSKVLEHDSTNVSVLVQRALLYESTEKYKLGAEDLRAVLKLDPTNRVAKSTIHRLNQLAG